MKLHKSSSSNGTGRTLLVSQSNCCPTLSKSGGTVASCARRSFIRSTAADKAPVSAKARPAAPPQAMSVRPTASEYRSSSSSSTPPPPPAAAVPPPSPPPPVDPIAAANARARASARQLVVSHRPTDVLYGRHHWMVVTVPEKPVAGEEVVVYFNKSQSDALRHCPSVFVHHGFNHWELTPDGNARVELKPTGLPSVEGSDFWVTRLKVPADTFELNFILTDGERVFENNLGRDFTFEVQAGTTWDAWIDSTAERVLKTQEARKGEERRAAAAAEAERVAACERLEKETGKKRANEARQRFEKLQENAMLEFCAGGPGGPPVFRLRPERPEAGRPFTVRYNRLAASLSAIPVPPNERLVLLYGFNGWQVAPGKTPLERSAGVRQLLFGADGQQGDTKDTRLVWTVSS